MKSFNLMLFALVAWFGMGFGSVVEKDEASHKPTHSEECAISPLLAYCLDMMHIGAEHMARSEDVKELLNDFGSIPIGKCSWGGWAGKVTTQDCLRAIANFGDKKEHKGEGDELVTEERFVDGLIGGIGDAFGGAFRGITGLIEDVGGFLGDAVGEVTDVLNTALRTISNLCREAVPVCESVLDTGLNVVFGAQPQAIASACDISPEYAYCVQTILEIQRFAGDGSSPTVNIPIGNCNWQQWEGRINLRECVQLIEQFQ